MSSSPKTLADLAMSTVAWRLEDTGNNRSSATAKEMETAHLIVPGHARELEHCLDLILAGRNARLRFLHNAREEVKLWRELFGLAHNHGDKSVQEVESSLHAIGTKASGMRMDRRRVMALMDRLHQLGWVRGKEMEEVRYVMQEMSDAGV